MGGNTRQAMRATRLPGTPPPQPAARPAIAQPSRSMSSSPPPTASATIPPTRVRPRLPCRLEPYAAAPVATAATTGASTHPAPVTKPLTRSPTSTLRSKIQMTPNTNPATNASTSNAAPALNAPRYDQIRAGPSDLRRGRPDLCARGPSGWVSGDEASTPTEWHIEGLYAARAGVYARGNGSTPSPKPHPPTDTGQRPQSRPAVHVNRSDSPARP